MSTTSLVYSNYFHFPTQGVYSNIQTSISRQKQVISNNIMEGEEKPLKLYFIPYLASGHMIPLCDIARLFASRGHHVTIITTPYNAKVLHKSNPYQEHFHIHTFPFPSQEVGLPDGIENTTAVTDLNDFFKVYQATVLLRASIEKFVEQDPPDCIVADFLYPWVDELAKKLSIPRFSFNGFSLFTICAMEAVKKLPIETCDSFTIPYFPHDITINSAPPEYARGFLEPLLEVMMKSDGLIVNNFAELDGEEYIDYYHKVSGSKAWHLGPACLIRKTAQEKAERGQQSMVKVHDCLNWLNSKPPNSVIYICFGSICLFPDNQLYEIACGIEASGHSFIWVVPEKREKKDESEEEKEKWLPKGFEERNNRKGIIIKGWAPQFLILTHPSVGAFLTHCGWNSMVEAVSAGVPVITWPVHSDQFYNEKLFTRVWGIGVELGAKEWTLSGYGEREDLVGRDCIENIMRRLMDDGDEGHEIRKCAQEFGRKAREATKESGSSYNNLTALIEELKGMRDRKPT